MKRDLNRRGRPSKVPLDVRKGAKAAAAAAFIAAATSDPAAKTQPPGDVTQNRDFKAGRDL